RRRSKQISRLVTCAKRRMRLEQSWRCAARVARARRVWLRCRFRRSDALSRNDADEDILTTDEHGWTQMQPTKSDTNSAEPKGAYWELCRTRTEPFRYPCSSVVSIASFRLRPAESRTFG